MCHILSFPPFPFSLKFPDMDNLYANILSCLSSSEKGVVALTGGGGKTTFMISFSSFLKKQGKSVLMTTTTKIESPRYRDYGAARSC